MVSRIRWLPFVAVRRCRRRRGAIVFGDSESQQLGDFARFRVIMLARRTTDIACSPRAWAARISLAVMSFFTALPPWLSSP